MASAPLAANPRGLNPRQTAEGAADTAAAERWQRLDWALLIAATLVAAALRWLELDAVPPGLHHDEAINGLAGQDILKGRFFLLYGFDAREPLFHWLVAGGQLIWGPTFIAVRSASALAGTLAVPAVYLLSRRMFGRGVAACAAFGLAASVWHLWLSRFGVRGVTLPLLLAITCYFLWEGRVDPRARRRSFVLAGLFLGLTGYTYISARAVPVLLGGFVAWQIACERPMLRRLAHSYLLALIVAIVVFAPMGYVLVKDPDLFGARSAKLSLLDAPDAPLAIAHSAARTLAMFVLAGDPTVRHNLDGRPVFDPVGAAFFLLGVATALRRWRQPAYAFCVLWLVVMLLPGILSISSPHFIRTLGSAPAAYVLLGIGVVTLGRWLTARLPLRWYALGVALWLLGVGVFTYHGYFQDWARRAAMSEAWEVALSAPARYLATAPPGPAVVLFPYGYAAEYRQVFDYVGGRAIDVVTWHDGSSTVLLPQDDPPAPPGTLFLVLGDNTIGEELVRALPGMVPLESARGADGAPLFASYQATEQVRPWPMEPARQLWLDLGGVARLEGYTVLQDGDGRPRGAPWQAEALPGGALRLRVYWRVLRPTDQPDLRLFFHLTDSAGERRAAADVAAYPSEQWRGGERALTWIDVVIPHAVPPGKYELRAGAYAHADRRRLPVTDEAGRALGDSGRLMAVKVAPLPDATAPQNPSNAELIGGPRLLGYEFRKAQGVLRVTLFWRTMQPMARDYTVFVHVTDASGRLVAQQDGPPAGGRFPTSYWAEGETIRDEHVVALGSEVTPGSYSVRVGMYQPTTGLRLPNAAGGDTIGLADVTLP